MPSGGAVENRSSRGSLPTRVVELATLLLILTLIGLVTAQVFMRYVMKSPLTWSEEAARMAFVWLTFLGAGVAFSRRQNLRISILLDALPLRGRLWLRLAVYVLEIGFMAVILYYSVPLLQATFPAPTPALEWSTATFYGGVAVGGAAIFAYAVIGLKDTISEIRELRRAG